MLVIVGFVGVIGAVLGGFVMAGGALGVMVQPSEFVVIGGAALGSLLVSTPGRVIADILTQLKGTLSGAGATKKDYEELLGLLFQIFKVVQQSGPMGLEAHFEDPSKSTILSKYPKFLARHHAVALGHDGSDRPVERRHVVVAWRRLAAHASARGCSSRLCAALPSRPCSS